MIDWTCVLAEWDSLTTEIEDAEYEGRWSHAATWRDLRAKLPHPGWVTGVWPKPVRDESQRQGRAVAA